MFEITLTCDDSRDQEFCCNQIQVHLLDSYNFNLNQYFQDVLQAEVNQITFDGWEK